MSAKNSEEEFKIYVQDTKRGARSLVHGFVRQSRCLLFPPDSFYFDIPVDIADICYSYYWERPVVIKRNAKVLIAGDKSVGKTSVINQYVFKSFESPYKDSMCGLDFHIKRHIVYLDQNIPMKLTMQLWQLRFTVDAFISRLYYRHAVAAVIVIDVTAQDTLHRAKLWKEKLDRDGEPLSNGDHIPCVLFVNKWDLVEGMKESRITDQELDMFCEENHFVGWLGVSAKSGLNVRKGMHFVMGKILQNMEVMDANIVKLLKDLLLGDNADDDDVQESSPSPPLQDYSNKCVVL